MSDTVARPDGAAAPAVRRRWRSLLVAGLSGLILAGGALAGANLWAAHHRRAARSCVERYHNAEAQEHLNAVLKVWPHDPEVLLLAARTARRLGAADHAAHFLDECQKVRGKDDADLFLEQVLLRVEQGEADRLVGFCRALVEKDHPSTPLVLEALTRARLHQLRYGDATEMVAVWRQRRPEDVGALFYDAFLADQKFQHREAADAYRRVLEHDPDHDEARGRLVEVLLQRHAAAEALPHVEHLRRRWPDDPRVDVFLARCRDQLGQSDEAERLLDGVLARFPQHGPALYERGQLALRNGQAEAAERWLREAVAREPGDYRIRFQYFLALQRNGKADEAAAEQQRLDQVRADMEKIQEIVGQRMGVRPHDARLHYEVALIALRAGSLEEGKRWLHSALKEDPQLADAHRTLALVYERTGEPALAARHRRLADTAASAKASPP
jgi:tetratricopeptide (TPR) repeat protein